MSATRRITGSTPALSLYKSLFKRYGPQHWWPARTRWEMMVGALLTQNTAWTNVEIALHALTSAKVLVPRKIARMPIRELRRHIRPSGFFRQKSVRLKRLAREYVRDSSIIRDRERLLALPGIGPETADSILLYAGNQPAFVVDAYTLRIVERLGWFKNPEYHAVQMHFVAQLPREVRLYNEYHALLVRLAKEHCRSQRPTCTDCPVRRDCVTGRGTHER